MRNTFVANDNFNAGLWVSSRPWRPINQCETAKSPDLDALSSHERLAHHVDDFLYNEVGIGWRELWETGRQSVN
jgi:hypothetical protein